MILTIHFPAGGSRPKKVSGGVTASFFRSSGSGSRSQETPSEDSRHRNRKDAWTPGDIQFLRDNWNTQTTPEIASALGRTPAAVASFACKTLGLIRSSSARKALRAKGKKRADAWTAAEKQYLIDNWETKTRQELADELGRVWGAVKSMGRKLNLKKPSSFLSQISKRPNAGQFKKGNLPANTVYGDEMVIRTRHPHKDRGSPPYKWIRIGFKQWKEYHRWLWELHHGPIPKEMLVVFKNGDTLDVRIDNLELISRADNARRNVNYEKASETMRQRFAEGTIENPFRNADDVAVAAWLTKDPDMQKELLKHPDLIELKRQQIFLNRHLKQLQQEDHHDQSENTAPANH